MMKKIMTIILSLSLILVFLPQATTSRDTSTYDPMADVNRDGTINADDLYKVGQAYGSSYTPITIPNKTTVTTLQYQNNSLSFVNNSLVAVFPQGVSQDGQWKYTNLSGTVAFDLNANSGYIAIAWDDIRARHNYVNFTTNSLGEASVAICLDYLPVLSPSPCPIRMIPKGWIVMTVFDNNTGEPYIHELHMMVSSFTLAMGDEGDPECTWTSDMCPFETFTGIFAVDSFKLNWPITNPKTDVSCTFEIPPPGYRLVGNCTYRTDEYGGAYVVATVYP